MSSGHYQIASYSKNDLMFFHKPHITFFKQDHAKYSHFSVESMPQYFNIKPDFGRRVSCNVASFADLMSKSYLCAELPPIGAFQDVTTDKGSGNSAIACCAWAEKIGLRLIKSIELEINDIIIEKHTGDYLNILYEMNNKNGKNEMLDKMIGNVPQLTNFTNSKPNYKLFIPLHFWFCEHLEQAFPLISAFNSTVKINVEFNNLDDCLILGPTHCVKISEDVCLFEKGDLIYQNVNGIIYSFKFIYYDYIDKNLYYIKISKESLKANQEIYSSAGYTVTPLNTESLYLNKKKYFSQIVNLSLGVSYLLIDYILLEKAEKTFFMTKEQEYVISVLQYDNEKTLNHSTETVKINHSNPCTELIFTFNQDYIFSGYLKDKYNYCLTPDKSEEILLSAALTICGQDRLESQNAMFFNTEQPLLNHHNNGKGIYLYSFTINTESQQFAGYCNFSELSDAELKLRLHKNVSYNRPVQFRLYSKALRKLTIRNGLVRIE